MEINAFERICHDPDNKPRTVTGVSGKEYIFSPLDASDKKSPRVCKVDDMADIQMFMGITEGYRPFVMPRAGSGRIERPAAASTPVPVAEPENDASPSRDDQDKVLQLSVPKLRKLLRGKHLMSKTELELLLYAEKEGKNRKTVLKEIETQLGG